nr:DUF4468 domain-containing protein [uncultured Sediminibacterium sp.]
MKRKILLMLLFLNIFFYSFSQLPTKDGKVVYELIDSSLALSKNVIFDNAKLAVVESFVDANSVIQIDDKVNGEIVGKGRTKFTYRMLMTEILNTANYTIAISSRENKVRIKIYDIVVYTGTSGNPISAENLLKINNKPSRKTMEELNEHFNKLIDQIRNKIKSPSNKDF